MLVSAPNLVHGGAVPFTALATDYDGTLAHDGRVDDATLAALRRVRKSGRRLVLVTGRELEDLGRVFPALDVFDRVVAENGAVLHHPATRDGRTLADPLPPAFAAALRARGVRPLSAGRVIVATREPHGEVVREVLAALGLEAEVSLNKGAVMVLPRGVTKGSGVAAALAELGVDPDDAVAIGDAENDIPVFEACGCGVAVASALPAVKECADRVTRGANGSGVREAIALLLAGKLYTRTFAPSGTDAEPPGDGAPGE
jgi:hydroxymethylpyrimidine pyrophosphatase-like HAD family hydrolase